MATGVGSKQKRRWVAVVLIGLTLMLSGYLALRSGSVRITSALLERQLHVPVHLGDLELSLFGDTLSVTDLRLGQPEGFGSESMISAGRIDLVGWRGVLFPDRHLTALRFNDLTVNLSTLADGRSNLDTWIRSFGGAPEAEDTTTPKDTDPFAMKIDRIAAHGIRIVGQDDSVGGESFLLTVDQGHLELQDLIFGTFPDDSIGSMALGFEIEQPTFENARFTLVSRFGPFIAGDLSIRSSLRITGCLYRTFVPIIPSNTGALLGGQGFDADADFATAAGRLLTAASIKTSNGNTTTFTVQGTLKEPVFELPEVLANVASRMSGGAGRLINSTLGSGKEIIVGAFDTVASLGKGALHATGSFLKGAGGLAAGVVTADSEKSQSGFEEMTAGTGGHLAGAVTDSADAIGETGSRTSGALQNNPKFQKWVSKSPQRHMDRTRSLGDDLQQAVFPPVIESPAPATR